MKPFKPYLNQPRWCGADRQKVPYNPKTGNRARPNDLTTFATFKEAKALLRSRQTITSLGLRTGDGIVAVDFDCPSPLNLGQIDLSDFGGSGRIEDGSEAVFGRGRSAVVTGD